MGYLCANFTLPRPLCSRVRHDVRVRQTDIRRQTKASLNASALVGGGRKDSNNRNTPQVQMGVICSRRQPANGEIRLRALPSDGISGAQDWKLSRYTPNSRFDCEVGRSGTKICYVIVRRAGLLGSFRQWRRSCDRHWLSVCLSVCL